MPEYPDFFNESERQEILKAIKEAERQCSAELRVHLEDFCDHHPQDRAAFVFEELGMHETALRNGVLIYLAVVDHDFAIIGDIGIHQHVGPMFWQECRDEMQTNFQEGRFKQGVLAGIAKAAERLREFFPPNADDRNELPDDISMGTI